jgi:hypothetical protein
MRKASQKRSRRGGATQVRVEIPWQQGDRVRWRDRGGLFRRDVGDGEHVEVGIGGRIYRLRRAEIRRG